MHKKIKLLITILLLTNSFLFAKDTELENIFKNKQVEGTIVIESLNTKKIYIYNDKRAEMFFSPASTFKIPNSLIALNEGVVTKDSLIVWDKKVREYESWNKDQTLFQDSYSLIFLSQTIKESFVTTPSFRAIKLFGIKK